VSRAGALAALILGAAEIAAAQELAQLRRRDQVPDITQVRPDPATPAPETPAETPPETPPAGDRAAPPLGQTATVPEGATGAETAAPAPGAAGRPPAPTAGAPAPILPPVPAPEPTGREGLPLGEAPTPTPEGASGAAEGAPAPGAGGRAPPPATAADTVIEIDGLVLTDEELQRADPSLIYDRPSATGVLGEPEIVGETGAGAAVLADPERRVPGAPPFDPGEEPEIDPLAVEAPPPAAAGPDDFLPIPDRWRLADTLGLVQERWWDPYNQNTLKGDKPAFEGWCVPGLGSLLGEAPTDCFVVLTAISDTVFEPRSFPTPTGVQSTNRPDTNDLFGATDQFLLNQNLIHSIALINGNTTFRPQDLELRFTGVLNVNYTEVEEDRVLHVDPDDGNTRLDWFYGVQEAFVDYHLGDLNDRYDFYSTRVGVQPFSSDFRGFLFQDNQLGARLFGTFDNNLWQWNVAWFRRLEKDTNSGLNDVTQEIRDDDVFVANIYHQDFPILGFTSQASLVWNRNREGDDTLYFDDNGFLARPASIARQTGRDYDVIYAGLNGDGRIGRVNLTASGYYAFGEDDNQFTGGEQDISAFFGAAEASMDFDWVRVRLSGLYASGDDDPYDGRATGFDAIFENPQFAGGDTSYWIRQQIPLIGGGGVALSSRNAVLPALRHSKEHGQSNFVNPGLTLLGVGADFDVLPELRLSTNVNYLLFNDTSSLEALRLQSVDREIGTDLSVAAIWRPFQQQNVVLRLSGAALIPGDGFDDLYAAEDREDVYYSILGNVILTY
jgi:hypothetical protein